MQITPLPDTIEQLTFEAGPERTPGLHFSEIRESLLAAIEPKRYGKQRTGAFHTYIQGGFTFEYCLERAFASRVDGIFRPGEVERDGIICSPDGISLADGALEEFKFTWKSSLGAPEDPKFWGWIIQLKAYCYVLDLSVARLRAFFVNGDYKTFQPEYRVWQFHFTEEDKAETWRMLVHHAKQEGML